MTRDTTIALLAAGGLVLALLASGVLDGSGELELDADVALGGNGDRVDQDGDLRRPHALYRRPVAPSVGYSTVCAGGWQWITDPPSEWTP